MIRWYGAQEGLRRLAKICKKQRIGPQRGDRLVAAAPGHVWALDFQVDVTADGRRSGLQYDRRVHPGSTGLRGGRSFTAGDPTVLLDKIVAEAGRRPTSYGWTTARN